MYDMHITLPLSHKIHAQKMLSVFFHKLENACFHLDKLL